MKVCVITQHRVFNYGSALQAYATQKIIEKNNCECEIINYVSKSRTMLKQITSVPSGKSVKSIKGIMYIISRFPNNMLKYYIYSNFWNKYLNLSKLKYITVEDLRKNPPIGDIYMTGSDQVWNSDYNEGVDYGYFLDFGKNEIKRVSYAASIGMDNIDKKDESEYKRLLDRYNKITVRETKARKIIEQLGVSAECSVVLDPTLMLEKEQWQKIQILPKQKDYILVMILYNEECNIPQMALDLHKKTNLPIVELVWNPFKKRMWKTHYGAKTEEFLGYIQNAKYIITNSFHVTAFSLNYEKQFITVKREAYNSRVESLLTELGLTERYIEKTENILTIEEKVDYSKINNKMNALRKESMVQLKMLLKG